MGTKKVKWSFEERQAMIQAGLVLRRGEMGLISWVRHFRDAMQQVIKKERWRKIDGLAKSQITWFIDGIESLYNEERDRAEQSKVIDLTQVPTDIILQEFCRRFVEPIIKGQIKSIIPEFRHQIEDILTAPQKKAEPPTMPSGQVTFRERKPKVLIVGLLNGQEHVIRESHGKVFDLRFERTDNLAGLQNLARGSDYVLSMVRFIRHGGSQVVSAKDATPIICHGGMTSLKRELDNLAQV